MKRSEHLCFQGVKGSWKKIIFYANNDFVMSPLALNPKPIFLETLATTLNTRSFKSHSPNLDS